MARQTGRLFWILLLTGNVSVRAEETPDVATELMRIANQYQITIPASFEESFFPISSGFIKAQRADDVELRKYIKLFAGEFSLYPIELVRRAQLKRVILCKQLSYRGQLRNAIPAFSQNTLYIDVCRGSYSTTYLRKVIHHEFFHIIDHVDDGSLYRDARWSALNPPNFQYGNGGRNSQDVPTTSVLTDKFPGFLNHYATTGVEEDKAELFANLIVDHEYVAKRAKGDIVLNAKIIQLKTLLKDFCPDINEKFWEAAKQVPRE